MNRETRSSYLSVTDLPACCVLLGLVALLGCATPAPSDSETFTSWASEHAIPIDSLESPLPEASLAAFREAIGPAKVVGLGESRHDTREQLLHKFLLVRHLVEDLDFRVVILEESFPHAEALDRYVTSGEGDPRRVMNGLAGWYLWDTEEMLAVVEWLRELNAGRAPDRRVRVFGMDITAPAPGVREVLDTLDAAGVKTDLDARSLGLDLHDGDLWPETWARYGELSEARRGELRGAYDDLAETVARERAALVAASSESAYERTRWLAEIGRMGNGLFLSTDREQGGAIREAGMAGAVAWVLDREVTGENAVVWTHNLHAATSPFRMPEMAEGQLHPMGIALREALGKDYLAIGGTFGAGAYPADLPPGERVFETPSAEVLDGAMAKVGRPLFLVDLREVPPESAAARWLQQEREWIAQDARTSLVPGDAFDLVYFVEEISRAQPTPLALERYRTLGERQ